MKIHDWICRHRIKEIWGSDENMERPWYPYLEWKSLYVIARYLCIISSFSCSPGIHESLSSLPLSEMKLFRDLYIYRRATEEEAEKWREPWIPLDPPTCDEESRGSDDNTKRWWHVSNVKLMSGLLLLYFIFSLGIFVLSILPWASFWDQKWSYSEISIFTDMQQKEKQGNGDIPLDPTTCDEGSWGSDDNTKRWWHTLIAKLIEDCYYCISSSGQSSPF